MDMKRHDFESSIKCSDSYAKLIYMHGEKLFIFDDGKYKIAAMQLAWEIYCDRNDEIEGLKIQQAKVEELQKQKSLQELEINQIAQANQVWQSKCQELQKRVDAALQEVFKCRVDGLDRIYALDVIEQALNGGEA